MLFEPPQGVILKKMKKHTWLRRAGIRLAELILILIILSFLAFLLMYLAPGDPAEKRLTSQGVAVTKEVLEAERERLGLLRPFFARYGEWLFNLVRGDMGISFKDDLPVWPKLAASLKNTAILASCSFILAMLMAVPSGILAAVRKDHFLDHLIRILSFAGNALPNFLLSVILMYLLCIRINLFRVIADGSIKGLILPAFSLAIPIAARFTRQIRMELLSQMEEDYVTGLRSRGVKERYVIFRNVLRNSLPHMITMAALTVGTLMGGSVVIETVFRWPGIGKLVMDSITARDYPVIMGFTLIMGSIYMIVNLLADIAAQLLDPRTGSTGQEASS